MGLPFLSRLRHFLLRRWWRVLRNILRCFFLDMRFLTTEPTGTSLQRHPEGPLNNPWKWRTKTTAEIPYTEARAQN